MASEDLPVLDGLIEEILPDGRFRVHLDTDIRAIPGNDVHVVAHAAGKMRRFRVRSMASHRSGRDDAP